MYAELKISEAQHHHVQFKFLYSNQLLKNQE